MSKFKDRFHLTPEQSLFLAKKKWDENVYCGMKMENRAVTFPQTQTILNGINVPNLHQYSSVTVSFTVFSKNRHASRMFKIA